MIKDWKEEEVSLSLLLRHHFQSKCLANTEKLQEWERMWRVSMIIQVSLRAVTFILYLEQVLVQREITASQGCRHPSLPTPLSHTRTRHGSPGILCSWWRIRNALENEMTKNGRHRSCVSCALLSCWVPMDFAYKTLFKDKIIENFKMTTKAH